jgi:virginiamycin B lyase
VSAAGRTVRWVSLATVQVAVLAMALPVGPAHASAPWGAPHITEYPLPVGAAPMVITAGPDGNVWFGEGGGMIGRMAPDGSLMEFDTNASVGDLAAGPDGRVWFTDPVKSRIGAITSDGQVTMYRLATRGQPRGIVTGPDGNLWVTIHRGAPDLIKGSIARVDASGSVTGVFRLQATPGAIVDGPDGALWFTAIFFDPNAPPPDYEHSSIGRITTDGVMTFTQLALHVFAGSIVAGPDGNLWFDEPSRKDLVSGFIGRVTREGRATRFRIPEKTGPFVRPEGIAVGPDGNLWFGSGSSGDVLGRITPSGHLKAYVQIPTPDAFVWDMVRGPDGRLWFTEYAASKIGAVSLR